MASWFLCSVYYYYYFFLKSSSRNFFSWHCHLWPFRLCDILTYYPTKGTIFEKKLLNTKYVFGIVYNVFLKHFSFWEEMSEIWSKLSVDLHVKYLLFLSDFNESCIFSTDFRKTLKYEISWKSFSGPKLSMQTNTRTDWRDEANSSFSFKFCERV